MSKPKIQRARAKAKQRSASPPAPAKKPSSPAPASSLARAGSDPVMIFDGQCLFCDFYARTAFRLERPPRRLYFAQLQSEAGMQLCKAHGLPTSGKWNSFVIVSNGRAYTKWQASNELFRILGGPFWFLGTVLAALVPVFIGNWIYDMGWKYRKQVFGASDECLLPTKDMHSRTLA
jgi:predicted DCC family thiol-disulfide oxidoreductase YuxK